MKKTYQIAPTDKSGDYYSFGEWSKVSEQLFWIIVESKVKEITQKQSEKFDDAFNTVKSRILDQECALTVLDLSFQIKGK